MKLISLVLVGGCLISSIHSHVQDINIISFVQMLHCLSKLFHLPVTVQHLQDTGVGRTVNALRKYEGDTGEAAKALVAKWKAMVAAEDSSEGEGQQNPEENNNSPEEERHARRHDEHHRSNRDKTSHRRHSDSKKHREEEKSIKIKKTNSHNHSRKRRYGEENGKITEKRRWKEETESESSGGEDSFQAVEQEDNDSGHDSEARSTSQVSQNMLEDSSSDDGSQSSKPSPHVQDRDQSRSTKLHNTHWKHEKHKVRDGSSKEKGHNSQKGDGVFSSHEGKSKTENKSVDESKQKKGEKWKVEAENNEHHHNGNSKKHKSKTESHGSNIPNISESSSKSVHVDKMSFRMKKEKLSAEEEEDGSIDCSTGMFLELFDIAVMPHPCPH
jgi:transcription elongation factor B polypeptide 3